MKKALSVIVGLFLFLALARFYAEREGARNERIRQSEQREASLNRVVVSLMHAYRVDTVETPRVVERFRDSIVVKWETLHDTVLVPVGEVRRDVIQPALATVARLDTTWRRCEALRLNCEARNAELAIQRDEWRARARPSLVQQGVKAAWTIGLYEGVKAILGVVR